MITHDHSDNSIRAMSAILNYRERREAFVEWLAERNINEVSFNTAFLWKIKKNRSKDSTYGEICTLTNVGCYKHLYKGHLVSKFPYDDKYLKIEGIFRIAVYKVVSVEYHELSYTDYECVLDEVRWIEEKRGILTFIAPPSNKKISFFEKLANLFY